LTTDGYLDAEHMQRDMYAADAVVLITSDSQYCGLGYVDIGSNDALAFSLISVYCPQSLAHEVGHNIGAHHDREAARNTDMSEYNFGYCWDTSSNRCSRSVMAYSGTCCTCCLLPDVCFVLLCTATAPPLSQHALTVLT
jgi:hypothetical protein